MLLFYLRASFNKTEMNIFWNSIGKMGLFYLRASFNKTEMNIFGTSIGKMGGRGPLQVATIWILKLEFENKHPTHLVIEICVLCEFSISKDGLTYFFYWRGRDSSCVGIYWWNVEGNGWIRYHNLPYQISIGVYALHYTAQMHEYATVLKPGHEEFAGVFSRMSTLAILVILHEGFSWWIHALRDCCALSKSMTISG